MACAGSCPNPVKTVLRRSAAGFYLFDSPPDRAGCVDLWAMQGIARQPLSEAGLGDYRETKIPRLIYANQGHAASIPRQGAEIGRVEGA
jgi:hypothetical protein